MNAQETLDAAYLMSVYAQEWQRTGRRPTWLERGATVPDSFYQYCPTPQWNWQHCHYRRKPEPKTVPLGLEDMVPGIQFRRFDVDECRCLISADASGLIMARIGEITYLGLYQRYEYRTPSNPEWRPCVKA